MSESIEPTKSESIEPSKDLDFYLAEPANQSIYRSLEEIGFSHRALDFFNLFYRLADLVENGKPLVAIKELDGLITGGFKLFIIYYLRERIRGSILFPNEMPHPSLFVINAEYERLAKLYPPDIFVCDSESIDDRARAQVAASELSRQVVDNMMTKMMKEAEERQIIELRARESERERIQTLIPSLINEMASAAGTTKRNPEFTTNRQVLALCYMLKQLGVKNIDKTVQAQFIEFLTGKNYKKIYDSVREVDELVFIKGGEDAKYVRERFEKLGLTGIVEEIDAILDKKS